MNNLKMLMAAMIMMISVVGCSKDDNNNDELSIVGTWQQESSDITVNAGIPGIAPQTIPDDDPATVVFNSNGTGTRTGLESTDNFSWTLAGDRLTLVFDDNTLILNLTTHTRDRLVGEQNFTLAEIIASGLLDEETLELMQMFPNLTAQVVMTLTRE